MSIHPPRVAVWRLFASLAGGVVLLFAGLIPVSTRAATPMFHSLASPGGGDPYTPAQVADAYDFTALYNRGLDGSGQKIALIETGTVNSGDLAWFDSSNNLPAAHITQHFAGGHTFTLQYDPEATLDVEWAHALAPKATILLFYVNPKVSNAAGWAAMGSSVTSAVSHGAGAVSISLGTCGAGSGYQAMSRALAAAEAKGVSVFVSSGDDGDLAGPAKQCGTRARVGYPAADPSVVAVGGTTLELDAAGALRTETAWSLSGGGVTAAPRPSWQVGPTIPAGTTRWSPDVSFLGDPATGVETFYHGRWHEVGGTSLGAPAWAAAWALIRQDAQQSGKHAGAAESLIYRIGNSSAHTTAFHDILTGTNGHYSAGPGWDPVTGWGSPDVANLDTAVLSLL